MSAKACSVYKDLLKITAKNRKDGFLKNFQGDLIRHDKKELKGYCGPYLWAVRENGTHLLTPKGACFWKDSKSTWNNMVQGEYGKARVYYSPDGRPPRKVSGAVPGMVAARWQKACTKRFDPWTGNQISGSRRR